MFKDKDAFENKNWTLFIHSYQKIKPLSSTEIRAVPIFVAIRDIWLMGLTELVRSPRDCNTKSSDKLAEFEYEK